MNATEKINQIRGEISPSDATRPQVAPASEGPTTVKVWRDMTEKNEYIRDDSMAALDRAADVIEKFFQPDTYGQVDFYDNVNGFIIATLKDERGYRAIERFCKKVGVLRVERVKA